MTIKKEITRLEKSRVNLSINIGKDDVLSEYNELLATYSKTIQLPGFRKGKVPQGVLINKFGDALKDEALGKIIEKAVENVLSDEAFPRDSRPLPYATPQVQDEPKLDLEKDLQFSVIYDVLPQVKVEKWQGLEVEYPDVAIEEEDIGRELESIRDRNSIVIDKSEGEGAAKGDVVTVDYWELDDEGNPLEHGARKDFSYTLGSGYNAYKFDDEISGMKKGETREFSKTYGEDDKELSGKTIKLKVSLSSLKIKKLPDLDDELAQDVDEKFKTLDDLKNSIRERLVKDLERRIKDTKINNLLEKMIDNTPVEIPESMLKMELDARWRNLARQLNTDVNGLYKILGNSPERTESIIDSWKGDATRALHSRLIVETLIEELKLEASDEEVEKEHERMASESGASIEEVKKYYESGQMREYLKDDIKERKLFDMFLEKNTIKAGKKQKYMDLISKNG